MQRVLLTAGRLPVALELARALHRRGLTVFAADSYQRFVCQASNAVTRCFHVPAPREHPLAFRECILDIIRRERVDVVVPCGEEVLYLATARERLARVAEPFFPDQDLLLTLHHKLRFNELCMKLGLSVPASAAYIGQSVLPEFAQKDYVLKRAYSRAGVRVHFAPGGTRPERYLLPKDGSWLMQERMFGRTVCSFSLVRQGQVLRTYLYQPGAQLGSISVIFCHTQSPRIEAWIERLAKATGFHGFLSLDFIENDRDVFAVECNPRVTSGVHLADPAAMVDAIVGRPLSAQEQARPPAQVTLAVLSALPQILREPQRWQRLLHFLHARDVIWDAHDPWPVAYQVLCYAYFYRQAFKKQIPFAACPMDGYEWDDDRSILPAFDMRDARDEQFQGI
jgi:hypothetical protein